MARLRSYLVRATYDWLTQHGLTPHFLVDAEVEDVEVPWEYVEEGKIVLNATPAAVHNLQLKDDFVGFEASFSNKTQQVFFPMDAVLALYARETDQGIYAREENLGMLVNEGESHELDPVSPSDDNDAKDRDDEAEASQSTKKGRGGLRLV